MVSIAVSANAVSGMTITTANWSPSNRPPIAVSGSTSRSLREARKELVAGVLSQGVVDVGHAIEIDEGERDRLFHGAFGQRRVDQLDHLAVIG